MADHPRAARWDTAAVLAGVALATGVQLADEGSCGTGQIGAAYVRWPDGHRSVLTCGPPGLPARRAGVLTAAARAAGVPAPGYELVVELGELTAVVQELLPGGAAASHNRADGRVHARGPRALPRAPRDPVRP